MYLYFIFWEEERDSLDVRLLAWPLVYFNYYSFLDDCEEFETCNCIVFQNYIIFLYSYRSPISVPFSCIHIDFLYRYYFPVLKYMIVISTMSLLDTWLLHAITWLLLVITWHLFDITYHLPPAILPLDLWLSYFKNPVQLSCIIYTVTCISSKA